VPRPAKAEPVIAPAVPAAIERSKNSKPTMRMVLRLGREADWKRRPKSGRDCAQVPTERAASRAQDVESFGRLADAASASMRLPPFACTDQSSIASRFLPPSELPFATLLRVSLPWSPPQVRAGPIAIHYHVNRHKAAIFLTHSKKITLRATAGKARPSSNGHFECRGVPGRRTLHNGPRRSAGPGRMVNRRCACASTAAQWF
jgi:hypothetical protein